MEPFYLDTYLEEISDPIAGNKWTFNELCRRIRDEFLAEWAKEEDLSAPLRLQKNAITGCSKEMAYFKEKIGALVEEMGAETTIYPTWYTTLIDGVYQENWGMAGVAQWFEDPYKTSSSAKVIGDRIYYLSQGKMMRMPQTISQDRREQMVRSFLLLCPEERMDKEFYEVYLRDGTRITIFREKMTKEDQDVIIFRRYVIPEYTFQEQAMRKTIPEEGIPLFLSMVKIGYNVAFTGAVRTAKTTFLSTWQSYEDPTLEGVMVETDPEIPMHHIVPAAPIIQIIADNDRLSRISKNLMRSDADYFILAEARDGTALDAAVRIASKGTRRMKITFHCQRPTEFPYDAAWEIVHTKGGDLELTARKVAGSFDYVFHFIQGKDKREKRLDGIYEIGLDPLDRQIVIHRICALDIDGDSWVWTNRISSGKREIGLEENPEEFRRFARELASLAQGSASAVHEKKEMLC